MLESSIVSQLQVETDNIDFAINCTSIIRI